jgi:hypothetical protein
LAIVTNVGRDAVAAVLRKDDAHRCGRRSRVVLTPRRWRHLAIALCVTSEWWQESPAHQGDHEVSRKAIAQGRPVRSGEPVVTCSCAFYFCTRGCGCIRRPVFPAPSHWEGHRPCITRALLRRGSDCARLRFEIGSSMPVRPPRNFSSPLSVHAMLVRRMRGSQPKLVLPCVRDSRECIAI